MRVSANNIVNTQGTQRCFTSIGCFKGTISLQFKNGIKPYQVPPSKTCGIHTVTAIQRLIYWLHKEQIIVPLGVYKISEWYKNFVLEPKPNGKVRQYLDPAR